MIFRFVFIFYLFFFTFSVLAEDNLLTLKQQIDRLQREVNDLSKSVFNKSDDTSSIEGQTDNLTNITVFDKRIYDIEKDIKNLNLSLEDIVFQIDEIKLLYEEIIIKINSDIINQKNEIDDTVNLSQEDNEIITDQVPDNTLGTLTINSEDLSEKNNSSEFVENSEKNESISPEEQFQKAFDLLRSQKFEDAQIELKNFIADNNDHNLSGSAHYWLGEIHLLKKEYREAALIFAEGYQKHPNSSKAPDNLYKLANALSKIDKKNESCNTLKKLLKEHPNHKLFNKAEDKLIEIECE